MHILGDKYAVAVIVASKVSYFHSSGAGDGIRTRDFHLGKVTLYH